MDRPTLRFCPWHRIKTILNWSSIKEKKRPRRLEKVLQEAWRWKRRGRSKGLRFRQGAKLISLMMVIDGESMVKRPSRTTRSLGSYSLFPWWLAYLFISFSLYSWHSKKSYTVHMWLRQSWTNLKLRYIFHLDRV